MLSRGRRPAPILIVFLLMLVISSFARAGSLEANPTRRPISREATTSPSHRSEASGGWWVGTAGIAVVLAACGWASLASRKFLPKSAGNAPNLRVVGRTSLSPKHAVYLLDVGGRVLLIGTGPQGAPSLLGELDGDEAPALSKTIDVRVGDDR